MKINRRMSIGTILGGIFSSPSVAKEMLETKFPPSGEIAQTAPNLYADKPPSVINHAQSIKNRISKLQKIINGELEPWQIDNLDMHIDQFERPRIHVASLKSISDTYKVYMLHNELIKLRRKSFIDDAIKELKQLMSIKS